MVFHFIRVREISQSCQTWPAKFGQILLRTCTRLEYCNRKLMRTAIFFSLGTPNPYAISRTLFYVYLFIAVAILFSYIVIYGTILRNIFLNFQGIVWNLNLKELNRKLAHGRWFSPDTLDSSTAKTGRHDIADILLKVALQTTNQSKKNCIFFQC